jgi:UDP-2,4-diacetamido-2,4,6-trideoxy-beta-L-altropyranose hydrolase
MRALFRVDAGPEAGLGHLQRCLSLALALREHGCESSFVLPAGEDRVRAAGLEVGDGPADVVVVDSYRVGPADLVADVPVVFVDDRAAFEFPCEVVLNGGAHARDLPYRGAPHTRFLLGPEYALLRPEFWSLGQVPGADPGPWPEETRPQSGFEPTGGVELDGHDPAGHDMGAAPGTRPVERVLVLTGGSDPLGLGPKLLAALEPLPAGIAFTIVVGPLAANGGEVEAAARVSAHDVEVVVGPSEVLELMRSADLAVSAAGQTLYELAAAGTPSVAVQIADNQGGNLRALAAAGVIRAAGHAGERSLSDSVLENCVPLVESHEARRGMAAAGRRLVDGRGALRAAAAIVEVTGS